MRQQSGETARLGQASPSADEQGSPPIARRDAGDRHATEAPRFAISDRPHVDPESVKSVVHKDLAWGFLLSEQQLRRIFRKSADFMERIAKDFTTVIEVTLRDGYQIRCQSIDDVISIENHGRRAITGISMRWHDNEKDPKWLLELAFRNTAFHSDESPIHFRAIGQSRDWVFLASSEIEEELNKTKRFSIESLWPGFFWVVVLIVFMFIIGVLFKPGHDPYLMALDTLQKLHSSGKITDPIDAMVFLDRARASSFSMAGLMYRMFGSLISAILVALLLQHFLPRMLQSYVFYWADEISRYDRRASIMKALFIAIILGAIASILGGLILNVFQK